MSTGGPGIVLLAAGNSSRMGRPKQLLPWGKSTLLRHAAETALAARLGPVIVVLGAEAGRCRAVLEPLADLHVAVNEIWRAGMGGSLRTGLKELERLAPATSAVLVLLHDQPSVMAPRLRELAAALQPGDAAVASVYEDAIGVPALFTRELFPELHALDPRAGARFVLEKHVSRVRRFPMPEARHDLDTPADYEALQVPGR